MHPASRLSQPQEREQVSTGRPHPPDGRHHLQESSKFFPQSFLLQYFYIFLFQGRFFCFVFKSFQSLKHQHLIDQSCFPSLTSQLMGTVHPNAIKHMSKITNCLTSFDKQVPGGPEISEKPMEAVQFSRFPSISTEAQRSKVGIGANKGHCQTIKRDTIASVSTTINFVCRVPVCLFVTRNVLVFLLITYKTFIITYKLSRTPQVFSDKLITVFSF